MVERLFQPTHLFFILLFGRVIFGSGNTAMKSSHDKRTVSTVGRWLKFLMAILLGNGLYFTLSPYLPAAARHQMYRLDLGTVVDLWFCLFVYGLVELAGFLERRRHGGV
jgi:hypothetical protein